MMIRRHAMIDARGPEALVERPAPGMVPTAFRIWAAGQNDSDEGPVFFTPASAEALMAEQVARARVYSIDYTHKSVTPEAPATEGKAAGWHNLAVRPDPNGAPELWAINVEWCAPAKAGLEADPPEWRFFSPAFLTDKAGEVTSYINLALCINPLTHGLPALASQIVSKTRSHSMKNSEIAARLKAMADAATDEKVKEAYNVSAAAFADMDPDGDGDAPKETKAADGDKPAGDKPAADKEPEAKATKAAEADEKSKDDESEKKEAKHAASLKLAQENVALSVRLDALEIKDLLATRPDLPEATRAWCSTQSKAVVASFLTSTPKAHAARPETATTGAGAGASAGLTGRDLEEMNAGMGMHSHGYRAPEKREDGTFVMHVNRPSDARAHAAKKGQA